MYVDIFNTDNKYQVIYADPPWPYRNKNTGGSMISGAANKYPVMDMADIINLPVPGICDRNAALFLWATTPLLPDCLAVLKAWGFRYITAVYWHKTGRLGLGFWYRGQVEPCLLGIRGQVKAFRIQKKNIIQSKVREHSRKPDDIYEYITATDLQPRIELFARQEVAGFDCWGNGIKKG